MKYRREIDGLRALAVLPVIFFHAGFRKFSGGFAGVDIFFVISGYLITTILLAELDQGKFSIVNFYERRARRVLPALFFVMAVAVPFAWILLPPSEIVSFSKSLIAVPLFVSNFFFWREGGYFEVAGELKPLLHTWSLAVEEQYYLFFPIFLLMFWKLGRRRILSIIVVVAVLSLVAAQLGALYKPKANFFILPTRAWEIAVGVLVSFYLSGQNQMALAQSRRQALSGLGFCLILVSIFLFDRNTPFPSIYALVPTLGAALLLLFAFPDTFIGRLLGNRAAVAIGLISYSAYLWHQPIFAFYRYFSPTVSAKQKAALVLITLVLSAFSWRFVERPFRDKNGMSRKTIFTLSLVGSLAFIIFGFACSKFFDASSIYGVEAESAKALAKAKVVYSENMDERTFIKFRIQFEDLHPRYVVLGSSRVMQIGMLTFADRVLNLGVSGSTVEDIVAIANMATKKFKPETIVVGLDPWLFNSKSGQERWKSLNDEYFSALNELKGGATPERMPPAPPEESFLGKIGMKLYAFIGHRQYEAADEVPELRQKIRRDGSRIYDVAYSTKSQDDIREGFESLLNYGMQDYEFSVEEEKIFGQFVDAYAKKYTVILVLPPYHPNLYNLMKSEHPVYLKIESQFREFAEKHGVKIIGSYNPAGADCGVLDFYDGMHPRDDCMSRVMKELRVGSDR